MRLNYTPQFKSLILSPGYKENFNVNTSFRNIKLPFPPREKKSNIVYGFHINGFLFSCVITTSLLMEKVAGRHKF